MAKLIFSTNNSLDDGGGSGSGVCTAMTCCWLERSRRFSGDGVLHRAQIDPDSTLIGHSRQYHEAVQNADSSADAFSAGFNWLTENYNLLPRHARQKRSLPVRFVRKLGKQLHLVARSRPPPRPGTREVSLDPATFGRLLLRPPGLRLVFLFGKTTTFSFTTMSNQTRDAVHAVGVWIGAGHIQFFDPNDGLYDFDDEDQFVAFITDFYSDESFYRRNSAGVADLDKLVNPAKKNPNPSLFRGHKAFIIDLN